MLWADSRMQWKWCLRHWSLQVCLCPTKLWLWRILEPWNLLMCLQTLNLLFEFLLENWLGRAIKLWLLLQTTRMLIESSLALGHLQLHLLPIGMRWELFLGQWVLQMHMCSYWLQQWSFLLNLRRWNLLLHLCWRPVKFLQWWLLFWPCFMWVPLCTRWMCCKWILGHKNLWLPPRTLHLSSWSIFQLRFIRMWMPDSTLCSRLRLELRSMWMPVHIW